MKIFPARLMMTIAALLVFSTAAAGDIKGSLILGTGYLDNPLGINNDTSASYLSQALRLSTTLGAQPASDRMINSAFKLGYEGNASQFGSDTSLGNMRHGLGVEWFRTSRTGAQNRRTNSIGAGGQMSQRSYEGYYQVYDYSEAYGYLSFRKYMTAKSLFSGFAAVRARRYGELPEESFFEPHGQLKMQRFFASRTTLGLSVRLGLKKYNDSAAAVIWDTPSLPSTSQMAARLNIAQGLSDRFSLRGRVDSRWTLSDFPYYVADDIYDSPLLDTYAHEGWDIFVAMKWLGPAQVWAELGASRGEHDYGSMLFATAASGEMRDDTVNDLYLSLERSLSGKALGPKLQLASGWRDQDSNIDTYSFAGIYASSRLSWRF